MANEKLKNVLNALIKITNVIIPRETKEYGE